jgi:hypothetical protein
VRALQVVERGQADRHSADSELTPVAIPGPRPVAMASPSQHPQSLLHVPQLSALHLGERVLLARVLAAHAIHLCCSGAALSAQVQQLLLAPK